MLWEKDWPKQEPLIPALPTEPIYENIRKQARNNPDKVAINFYGYEMTYKELDLESDRFGAALVSYGAKKGDRVALYMENCPQFVIAFYGILKIGSVVVNVSPMYKTDELEHELKDAKVDIIVMLDHFYPVLGPVRESCGIKNVIITSFADYLPDKLAIPVHASMASTAKFNIPNAIDFKSLLEKTVTRIPEIAINMEQDLALLQYTGGTTGLPKGAMLTHWNLAVHGNCARHLYQYTEEDVQLIVLPLFHVTGLDIAMNPALAAGCTLILFARFDLVPALEVIQNYGVTVWVTITPINVAVITLPGIEKYDFSSLRLVLSGGAPVPLEIHKKWKAITGSNIVEGYGLSEACGGICGNNQHNFLPGKVGNPMYYHDIKIVDLESGEVKGPGHQGEMLINGPCVMKGYWNDSEATSRVLQDGWLRTGDMATMDEDGRFSIVGRVKEMIKVSGYSVFLAEIDAFLYQHPAVAEVATIGVPHLYRGEEPKCFIVLKPEYRGKVTEKEVIDWSQQKMAVYKYPRQVTFVNSLPKTSSGKILRRVLE